MQRYKAILLRRGVSHEEIDKAMNVASTHVMYCEMFSEAVKDLLSNYTESEITDNIQKIAATTPAALTLGGLILLAGLHDAGKFTAMEAYFTACISRYFYGVVEELLGPSDDKRQHYELFGGKTETKHLITKILANLSKGVQYRTLLNTFKYYAVSHTPEIKETLNERINIVMDLLFYFNRYEAQPSSQSASKKQELQNIIFSQLYPNDDGNYVMVPINQLEQQVGHYFGFTEYALQAYMEVLKNMPPPQEEARPASDFTP